MEDEECTHTSGYTNRHPCFGVEERETDIVGGLLPDLMLDKKINSDSESMNSFYPANETPDILSA